MLIGKLKSKDKLYHEFGIEINNYTDYKSYNWYVCDEMEKYFNTTIQLNLIFDKHYTHRNISKNMLYEFWWHELWFEYIIDMNQEFIDESDFKI